MNWTANVPIDDGSTVAAFRWRPVDGTTNFGDEIGPLVVTRLLQKRDVHRKVVEQQQGRARLLTVGSVLHFASGQDEIWGSGINGKRWPVQLRRPNNVRVHAVRGPLTKRGLANLGVSCPAIFGDPALLFPQLYVDEVRAVAECLQPIATLVILNRNDHLNEALIDFTSYPFQFVAPSENPVVVAAKISRSSRVISSSLHGLVLADALGIPNVPLISLFEPAFKYLDYYRGIGVEDVDFATNLKAALARPASAKSLETFNPAALLDAFPFN